MARREVIVWLKSVTLPTTTPGGKSKVRVQPCIKSLTLSTTTPGGLKA